MNLILLASGAGIVRSAFGMGPGLPAVTLRFLLEYRIMPA